MYIRISSLSFLGFLLFLTSCSSSKAGASLNPFLGKWITSDSTNIEFKENGKATFDGADITYSYGHDTLTLNQGNSKLHYKFKIDDNNVLHQIATFRPKGLWGRMYWYSLVPFHFFIFGGMIKNIANFK